MAFRVVLVFGLCVLAEASRHAEMSRSGQVRYIRRSAQDRQLLNYDHPAEREGVDLRSYNDVDFRSALAKKQENVAALVEDMSSEIGAVDNTDLDTSLTEDPPVEEWTFADMPTDDDKSPVAAIPVSYGVRIGEDGELDGGEDFGDHVDYNGTDAGEDYVEDGNDEEGDEDIYDWTAEGPVP